MWCSLRSRANHSDVSFMRPPPIPETKETAQTDSVAKEQKITPFDVEGGVDAEGKSLGM